MPTIAMLLKVEQDRLVVTLREAGEELDGTQSEVVLDFSSIRRVDRPSLHEMEKFANVAQAKSVKVVLSGVHVEVYRVLKLLKLTERFTFLF